MKLTNLGKIGTSARIVRIDSVDTLAQQYFMKLGITVGRNIKLLKQGLFNKNALFSVNNRLVNIPKKYQDFVIVKKIA